MTITTEVKIPLSGATGDDFLLVVGVEWSGTFSTLHAIFSAKSLMYVTDVPKDILLKGSGLVYQEQQILLHLLETYVSAVRYGNVARRYRGTLRYVAKKYDFFEL